MTNKDLINSISSRTGMTKKHAGDLLDSTISIMLDELMQGKQIQILEFGTFEIRQKNERVSVNPITQKRTIVPPKQQLSFKLSPTLKEKLNQR